MSFAAQSAQCYYFCIPTNREPGRSTVQVGRVEFEGDGPFYLRAVEVGTACNLAETVQLTLYAKIDGREQKVVQIETQMSPPAAIAFANQLLKAASEIHG